jgi:hypothetical protein
MSVANDLIGLMATKLTVIVSDLSPLAFPSWVGITKRLMCLSCPRTNANGQLPAMCPLLVKFDRTLGIWSFTLLEEKNVVHCPHKFHFECDLCGRECGVLTVKGDVYSAKLDNSKEVAMFGGEVKEG